MFLWLAPATFAYWKRTPLYEGTIAQVRPSSRCQETEQRGKSACQAAALLVWSSSNLSRALECYRDSIYTCRDSLFFLASLSLGLVLVKTSFEPRAASPRVHTRRRQWHERLAWPMFRSTSKNTKSITSRHSSNTICYIITKVR